MTGSVRVALVDDHPLFREGVASVLLSCPDVEVVAQGGSADEAAEIAQTGRPDVVLLDVSIPGGGLSAIRQITAHCPASRVMMLTVSVDKTDVLEALRLGARAYVVKGVSGRELVQALRVVMQGERYISPSLGAMLLSDVDSGKAETRIPAAKDLNSRETAILSLVTQGLTNKQIAARLQLSDKTVKHYMTSVFQKLHVRNRLEAALLMRKTPQSPSDRGDVRQRHTGSALSSSDQRLKTLV
jgi:two-component system, NarL family, nitrate/nitrite response regulator NarL